MPSFADGRVTLHAGDCLRVLAKLPENSVDSIVCDPPYHLTAKRGASAGFMGKAWDGGDIAFRPDVWIAALRVLKPGGHLVAFSAARTYHRLAVAIEDAGFEIRDQLLWLYGSGFPKSLDVSKAIDKAAGAKREIGDYRSPAHAIPRKPARERQHEGWSRPYMDDAALYDASLRCSLPATDAAREWSGWGTALKPAHEPLVCARKPLGERTVAANVLRWGCGALNIDACRVETSEGTSRACAGGFGAAFSDDNWTAPAETTTRLETPRESRYWRSRTKFGASARQTPHHGATRMVRHFSVGQDASEGPTTPPSVGVRTVQNIHELPVAAMARSIRLCSATSIAR